MDTSVAATSTPDGARTLKRRPGRPGLGSGFLVLLVPHFWVGPLLMLWAVIEVAFVFVRLPAEGVVATMSQHKDKNGKDRYEVRVLYRWPDGVLGNETWVLDAERFHALHEGDAVDVDVARIFGNPIMHARGKAQLGIVFAAIFWNSMLAGFLYFAAGRPILRWWLVKNGCRVEGKVWDVGADVKGRKKLRYQFTPAGSVDVVQASIALPVGIVGQMSTLPAITVFYHPTRPRWSVPYDATSWEIVSG